MAKGKKKDKVVSDILNVVFVLDETGSMQTSKNTTISGFNEYVTSLKNKNGDKTNFTLVLFNSKGIRTVYENKPVAEVELLTDNTYNPDATTPLYDAIGQTIKTIEKTLKPDAKVLFVTMTDGLENASNKYTRYDIFKLIKKKEDVNQWIFAFLGANQDSWETGSNIGMSKQASTMNYSQGEEKLLFGVLALATENAHKNYRRVYKAGLFQSNENKEDTYTSQVSSTSSNT